MKKTEIVIIADLSQSAPLTLEELCETGQIPHEFIQDLIEFEIVQPDQDEAEQLLFDEIQIHRIKTALRLQRELEVNMAGIAVVLDLLDELETLRSKTKLLEKHLFGK
jgi:chaperone modulatory protein CbpM